jgi:ferrochelatase
MPGYRQEPPYVHGTPARCAVLLVNLGTPAAPTAGALRTYLRQFLSDPRVVEIPRIVWAPILHGIILNTRPAKSAAKYAAVWTRDGSPLRVHTERQRALLQGWLGTQGHPDVVVDYAMRYGEPSIPAALDRLKAQNCDRVLVAPLYPQFAASTTASVCDEAAAWMRRTRNLPALRFVRSFHDDPGYIDALEASVREHWEKHGRAEKLVMSFHGVPRFSLDRGDPYHCECRKTGRLLAESLGLADNQWQLTFQSRFGRAEWLQPYTQPTLEQLARSGLASVDVICPGFVSDCLETLEEIAMECKTAFLGAGGKTFGYIPCLNERPDWIAALAAILQRQIPDWLRQAPPARDALARCAERAKALGAAQ